MVWALAVVAFWVALTVPAYVIGKRTGVLRAWVAFIPIIGSAIVLLWSMNASLWWLVALLALPFVFLVGLAVMLPTRHGRTRWWALAIVLPLFDVFALYAYAFTLPPATSVAPQPATAR